MRAFTCSRGTGSNDSNKLFKLKIPVETFPGGKAVRESDAAYGFKVNGEWVWLPKSQIKQYEFENNVIECWCPRWLVEKKGLEIFVDTSHEPGLFDEE